MKSNVIGELTAAGVWVVVSILWLGSSVRMILRGNSFGWFLSVVWLVTLVGWLYRARRTMHRRNRQGKAPDVQ
jgi:hypothetical protein